MACRWRKKSKLISLIQLTRACLHNLSTRRRRRWRRRRRKNSGSRPSKSMNSRSGVVHAARCGSSGSASYENSTEITGGEICGHEEDNAAAECNYVNYTQSGPAPLVRLSSSQKSWMQRMQIQLNYL